MTAEDRIREFVVHTLTNELNKIGCQFFEKGSRRLRFNSPWNPHYFMIYLPFEKWNQREIQTFLEPFTEAGQSQPHHFIYKDYYMVELTQSKIEFEKQERNFQLLENIIVGNLSLQKVLRAMSAGKSEDYMISFLEQTFL